MHTALVRSSSRSRSALRVLPSFFAGAVVVAVGLADARVGAAKGREVAPNRSGKNAAWSHAPYEVGACGTCHRSNNRRNPGKLRDSVSALCWECHTELQEATASRKHQHRALDKCTNCHNPHNGADRTLLVTDDTALCLGCHQGKRAKKACRSGAKKGSCSSCHAVHAAERAKLLR